MQLQCLELNFLTSKPEYLIGLLRAYDWSVLRSVTVYRPMWIGEERDYVPLWDVLFELEATANIKFEYKEQLGFGEKYTEEDIQYMVDHDIVPISVARYIKLKRGEHKALDEYVDRKERKKKVLPIHDPPCPQIAQLPPHKSPMISYRPFSLAPADHPTQPSADNETQPPADNPTQPPADNPIPSPADNPTQPPADNRSQPPADGLTQPPKKQSTPRWKASTPTYTPARPHKFSAPLLSSCIVPKYDAPSLHLSSSETQAYKPKKSTSSLELPSR